MASSFRSQLSIKEKGLRYKLLLIQTLICVLPILIFSYIFYVKNLFLELSQIVILALTLVLILSGLIILHLIFDRFLTLATSIKKAEAGDKILIDVVKETAELHDAANSFNSYMEKFEKTTEELRQRVFELFTIKELTEFASKSLDINHLLSLLLEKAMDVLNVQIGSIFLIDSTKERFRVIASRGLESGPKVGSYIDINKSLARHVLSDKKPLLVQDIETDARTRKSNDPKYGSPSFLSMPINVRKNLVGILNLSKKEKEESFNSNEEQLLSIMIGEIGFALENAQLHSTVGEHLKDLQERTKELAITNDQLKQEIAERKRAEESVRESEEKYRLLVENVNDAIFIVQDEVIKFPNPRTEEMTGYSAEELCKSPFIDLIHPEDRDLFSERQKRKLTEEETPGTYSYRLLNKGAEEFLAQINSVFINWEGKPATLNLARDITLQRRLETQLKDAQKMEAIATLAGGIAHQFNNALSVITGNIELLSMDLPDHENIKKHVGPMRDTAQNMARLTSQLLACARGGKYQAKTISLNDFVRDTLPLVKHTIDPLTNVDTDLPRGILNVKSDITQMQMVLSAILENASEAIEGPGRIRISTSNEEINEEFSKNHPDIKSGSYVRLTIEDSGKGMDEETRSRVFEPFFTTKFQGRGLGMAAAYGIIHNHDGWISIDSEIGKGTTVRIYFPAIKVRVKKVEKPKIELPKGTGTILVIEDEEMVMDITSTILEKLGYHVLKAKTGKEAINICKTFDGDINLAILDIVLPHMHGKEVYRKIMKVRRNLNVIVCSGYNMDGPAQEILDAGAQGFIQKPFSFAELSAKLREVLCQNGVNP